MRERGEGERALAQASQGSAVLVAGVCWLPACARAGSERAEQLSERRSPLGHCVGAARVDTGPGQRHRDKAGRTLGRETGGQDRHWSEQEPARAGEPKGSLRPGQKARTQKAPTQKQVSKSKSQKTKPQKQS